MGMDPKDRIIQQLHQRLATTQQDLALAHEYILSHLGLDTLPPELLQASGSAGWKSKGVNSTEEAGGSAGCKTKGVSSAEEPKHTRHRPRSLGSRSSSQPQREREQEQAASSDNGDEEEPVSAKSP